MSGVGEDFRIHISTLKHRQNSAQRPDKINTLEITDDHANLARNLILSQLNQIIDTSPVNGKKKMTIQFASIALSMKFWMNGVEKSPHTRNERNEVGW